MKKLLSIVLLTVFVLSVLGVRVSLHHCMGKNSFTLFEITFNKECKCEHSKSTHKPACCHDKTFSFEKNDDPFVLSGKICSVKQVVLSDFFHFSSIELTQIQQKVLNSTDLAHAPPEARGVKLNSLFCIFRI